MKKGEAAFYQGKKKKCYPAPSSTYLSTQIKTNPFFLFLVEWDASNISSPDKVYWKHRNNSVHIAIIKEI